MLIPMKITNLMKAFAEIIKKRRIQRICALKKTLHTSFLHKIEKITGE